MVALLGHRLGGSAIASLATAADIATVDTRPQKNEALPRGDAPSAIRLQSSRDLEVDPGIHVHRVAREVHGGLFGRKRIAIIKT